MPRRILPLLLLALAAPHAPASAAQEAPKNGAGQSTSQAAPQPAAEKFDALLQRLKGGDRTVDFARLRMAYAETADYDPYVGPDEAKAMFASMDAGDWDAALRQSAKILEKNYVDIDAHLGAHVAYDRKGDAERAAFHKFVLDGLVNSILRSGDGRSPEKAFVVISIKEEYTLLNIMGLRPAGQALIHSGGHSYDKFGAVNLRTNERQELYFQVDKPLAWLAGRRGKE